MILKFVNIYLIFKVFEVNADVLFARRGSNVTLSCPSSTRSWFIWQNNTVVNDGLRINPGLPNRDRLMAINDTTRNSINLHIRFVTDIDGTMYICYFTVNNTEWSIDLSIMDEPDSPLILNAVQGGSYIEGTEGQHLGMTCQSYNGNPPADVTWKTGQTDLATSKNTVTYQFTPTRTNHLQTYTCVSSSQALSNPLETSVRLLLKLGPLTPVVIVSAAEEGDDIVGHCVSTGSRPAARLSWLIDGELQTPTGQQQEIQDNVTQTFNVSLRYSKTSSRSDNTKILLCRANNTVLPSTISRQQRLNVWFGPDFITISGNISLYENTQLTLTCSSDISNPQSTITWLRNSIPLTVNNEVTFTNGLYGGTITRQNFSTVVRKVGNGANITCVASTVHRVASKTVIINVRYKPTVKIRPSSLAVIEGDMNVILNCVVTDSNPKPQSFVWMNGTSVISVNQNYSIPNIKKSDAGSYSCTATNTAGTSDKATSTLTVLYLPEIASMPDQTPEEGSDLTLKCTITTSNPAPSRIYWTRTKYPSFRIDGSTLSISNISREHTGTYTCHAENIMSTTGRNVTGRSQKDVVVDVLCPPLQMESHSSLTKIVVGNNRFLNITFLFTGSPIPTVEWMFDEGHVPGNGSSDQSHSLIEMNRIGVGKYKASLFKNLTNHDFGIYVARLQNARGRKLVPFQVIQQGRPDSPTDLFVDCTEPKQAKLYWTPGFDGLAEDDIGRQVFHILYKRQLDNNFTTDINEIKDTRSRMSGVVSNLSPERWSFSLMAKNAYGTTVASSTLLCSIFDRTVEGNNTFHGGSFGAGIGAMTAVTLVIVVGLIFWRKREGSCTKNPDSGLKKETKGNSGLKKETKGNSGLKKETKGNSGLKKETKGNSGLKKETKADTQDEGRAYEDIDRIEIPDTNYSKLSVKADRSEYVNTSLSTEKRTK